jgi:hypothetical protein
MSRRWLLSTNSLCGWTGRTLLLLLLCIASLVITNRSGAQGTLKLDESKTKIFLTREPAEVQLSIDSSISQSAKSQIHLDVLDPENRILATLDRDEQITGSRVDQIESSSISGRERAVLSSALSFDHEFR